MSTRLQQWAESRVESMTREVKGLIDSGLDMESAVDFAFEHSVLADSYKMRVLENVANYRHEHEYRPDIITGKLWCIHCQQFKPEQ